MIDLLYVSYNRFEMTRESWAALLANTNWDLITRLFVCDDGSESEMWDWWMDEQEGWREQRAFPEMIVFDGDQAGGGPVAAMATYLDLGLGADAFAKVDNDFVVCPGWLDELVRLSELNPGVDILGIEPMKGDPTMPPTERTLEDAEHIGGKGLIRTRAFAHCRPTAHGQHGYFGFTEWQVKHRDVRKAWVTPDLPCFGLDQLPFEPWLSLTDSYVERGWQRRWPPYHEKATEYWDWWTPVYDLDRVT